MSQISESVFTTRDETKLYTKTWKPQDPSSRHLIFIHGFSDHINAYYDLFPTLASSPYNITVHGFDQRGWGQSVHSQADWGLTGDTHQVLHDLQDFVAHVTSSIVSTGSSPKLFLMGHSMGGAEALLYMLSDMHKSNAESSVPIAGLLLESPFVALPPESAPYRLTVIAGRITAMLMPNMQMVQNVNASYMCRDPKVCKDWAEDPLCHNTGTLRGLAGMLDRANDLNDYGNSNACNLTGLTKTLPCPVWWAHGTADKVTDYQPSKKLYDKLAAAAGGEESKKLSKFVSLEGGFHKLHGEPDGMGKEFAKGAGDWILHIAPDSDRYNSDQVAGEGRQSEATAGTGAGDAEGSDAVKSRL